MRPSQALDRYLSRHIESDLPDCPADSGPWQQVLVIPAYRESPQLIDSLSHLPGDRGDVLVLLVLNRPVSDSDSAANMGLRTAVAALPGNPARLNRHTWLYLYDLERLRGPTARSQGVGLARKAGCDIALKWISQGALDCDWIYCSDADARLPVDYFQLPRSPGTVAMSLPFCHTAGDDERCNLATALYELRLHHYVLGLDHAGSPYAFHTLGSCLAVDAGAYAQVRGFPRRAGAEDFYLLNKLAKLGPVARPGGGCIHLQSRTSDRVPFGTGPAVAEIMAAADPGALPLFYHPAGFAALRAVLAVVAELRERPAEQLALLLQDAGLAADLAAHSARLLREAGLHAALAHCRRQGRTPEQFLRQWHQWFDGFRTLKLIHGIRDCGYPNRSLQQLQQEALPFWPGNGTTGDCQQQLRAIRRHWDWH